MSVIGAGSDVVDSPDPLTFINSFFGDAITDDGVKPVDVEERDATLCGSKDIFDLAIWFNGTLGTVLQTNV